MIQLTNDLYTLVKNYINLQQTRGPYSGICLSPT